MVSVTDELVNTVKCYTNCLDVIYNLIRTDSSEFDRVGEDE